MRRTIVFFTIFVSSLLALDVIFDYKDQFVEKFSGLSWFYNHNKEPDYYFPEEMIFENIKNEYILQALAYNDISAKDYPNFSKPGTTTCVAKGYILSCFNSSAKGDLNSDINAVIFNDQEAISLLLKYVRNS